MKSVQSGSAATPSTSAATSRRAQRAAAAPRSARPRPAALRTAPSWLPRAGILLALAGATIAVPVAAAGTPAATVDVEAVTVAGPGYPTAYDLLASGGGNATETSVLAAVRGAERVSAQVSRSFDREALPGCDGQARPTGSNGQIPASDLCALWDGNQMLRGDAAVALAELNRNFRAHFERDLCLTDSYRTLGEQRRLAAVKPGLAASPGTSNHGWGLAIDLCTSENRSSSVMTWLNENGPIFGWDNPQWARRGGSGAFEPWHWEYVPGTSEMGTNY